MLYPFKAIEKKFFEKTWTPGPWVPRTGKKYYVLEMLPYPSGKIHMGHVRNYSIGDALARFQTMHGYDVLHPMGWDAFGLPAENAALERNVHPGKWTYENIDAMKKQLKQLALSYDWEREVATCAPDYYKHEQRFFIEMYKRGLVYQAESTVNWDPVENTVLANEQVVDGRGWRSGAVVERKKLRQWSMKITQYAEELLQDLEKLRGHWPDQVLKMQENWIGKSEGAIIQFRVFGGTIDVYTTCPETIFGASFLAIAADHPFVKNITDEQVLDFIDECQSTPLAEEDLATMEKKGIATGFYAQHPFLKYPIPIYIANFVVMDYGTGALFGCPAHDERDYAFATKYKLPIKPVITHESLPHTGPGTMINSEFLDGLDRGEAKKKAIQALEKEKIGHGKTQYRLRDWGVSRQRYWGCPIPMIYCEKCGTVPAEDLPVELPEDVDFSVPGNPLDRHPSWKHTKCPQCGGDAVRETDTLDTFFESSWYFLRYCSPKSEQPFDRAAVDKWMPVDQYIGGIEHAVMHLLYARFFTKALRDMGYLGFDEPFANLLTQGMVCHKTYKTKDGKWLYPEEVEKKEDGKYYHNDEEVTVGRSEKMSKSKKNTVDPEKIIENYGADAVRLFILSDSPPEKGFDWSDEGLEGCWRYMNRMYKIANKMTEKETSSEEAIIACHKYLNEITQCYASFKFNKVIAFHHELSNLIEPLDCGKDCLEIYIKAIAPITPYIACAFLGSDMGDWPVINHALIQQEKISIVIQVNGKKRAILEAAQNLSEDEIKNLANPLVEKYLEGQVVKKVIIVPNRTINYVI